MHSYLAVCVSISIDIQLTIHMHMHVYAYNNIYLIPGSYYQFYIAKLYIPTHQYYLRFGPYCVLVYIDLSKVASNT